MSKEIDEYKEVKGVSLFELICKLTNLYQSLVHFGLVQIRSSEIKLNQTMFGLVLRFRNVEPDKPDEPNDLKKLSYPFKF